MTIWEHLSNTIPTTGGAAIGYIIAVILFTTYKIIKERRSDTKHRQMHIYDMFIHIIGVGIAFIILTTVIVTLAVLDS